MHSCITAAIYSYYNFTQDKLNQVVKLQGSRYNKGKACVFNFPNLVHFNLGKVNLTVDLLANIHAQCYPPQPLSKTPNLQSKT